MPFPTLTFNSDGSVTCAVPELKIAITLNGDDPQFEYETKETALLEAIRFWMQKNGIQTLNTLQGLPNALELFEGTTATLKIWVP